MKKTKMTTKALSVLLTVLMLFTTISVGIIVPDAKLETNAATVGQTHTVTTIAQLNSAISAANTAGANVITTIKLGQSIVYSGAIGKLEEITTGNVLFDFAGFSLLFSYNVEGSYGSDNTVAQIPSELAGSNYIGSDHLDKALITVREGGKLQIINTGVGNPVALQAFADLNDKARDGNATHQASSNLIYSEGTLILGDEHNSTYNEFIIYAKANARTNGEKEWYQTYSGEKGTSANAYSVTVNGNNSVFKMYGGTINASGISRSHRGSSNNLRVYALNIQSCYSAEIYGGSINLPDNLTSIEQSRDKASEGSNAVASAIRCNSPHLYIFDVESNATARTGSDSSKNNSLTLSNVYSTSTENAATIYGGNFSYSSNAADNNSTAVIYNYTIRGPYNIAVNNQLKKYYADGRSDDQQTTSRNETKTKTFVCYTLFIHDGGTAENGLDIFSYNTFRQYLAQLGTALDVYAGCGETASHHGDNNSYTCETYNYRRNGYTHTGWIGKSHPAGGLLYGDTAAASLNATQGGSLFLQPVWTENVYNITYDWNDSDGASKVTDTSSCPVTYKITSTSAFGSPVRHGYEFTGWAITQYEYPSTDTKKPWSLATYPAGFSLNGRNGHLWLQAQWKEIPYTATFNLDGGNIGGSTDNVTKDYTVNKVFQFPAGVQKDYYTFDGYYKVTTADGSWAANDTLYAANGVSSIGSYGNPTFTAQFTPVQYTVTYDSMLGSSVDDDAAKTYNVESTHTLPAVTRLGYHFAGWKPAASVGSWSGAKVYPAGFSFNGMNGNVRLEAQWESAVYKLTLDLAENEIIDGATEYNYAYANTLEIKNPSKTGYIFTGWEVSSTPTGTDTWIKGEKFADGIAEGSVTIPANKLGNVTLKANWTPDSYEITFDPNGGQGCANYTYDIEDSFNLPTTTKKGYNFAGWSVAVKDGNWNKEVYAGGELVNGMYGNVTLRANWEKTKYVVTLDTDGGTVNPSVLSYDFESIVDLPVPSKTGFAFKGWKVTLPDASASWVIDTVYTDALPAGQYGNVTLTALWEHQEYNIHFVSSGSTPSDLKYYIDSDAFNVPASSYPGYTFLYWNVTTPAGNWEMNEKVYTTTDITGKYGNVTLNANFEAVPFTITYKDIDGTTDVVDYNMTTPVTLKTYERAGYTFNGWRVETLTDGAGWAGMYQPGDYTAGERYGNVVLVPDLSATEYEITFIPDGGTPYANLTYTVEATDTLPVPEKANYDFAGWKVTVAGGNWAEGEIVNGAAAVTGKYGSVTLTAQWTPKKFKVTFVNDDGTVLQSTDVAYGTMPSYTGSTPVKEATAQYTYTFTGWSPALTTVTGEATYTAQYSKTVNSYTITWKYETDETSGYKTESSTYNYGEHPVFNNGVNPVKTSATDKYYRFEGWKLEGQDVWFDNDTYVTGDATYVAQFKEIAAPRTVIWVIDGVSQETKWEVGETPVYVGTPAMADKNGMKYTFAGWDPVIVEVAANTDYTYTAVFTESAKDYTATFDADGGYIVNTEVSYNKVNGLTMPVPAKDGYTFLGWRVTSNGGTWNDTNLLTYTTYTGRWGDVSFKAEYAATEYTIKVEADDGTAPEYKYTIESTDTLPALTKEGFVLSGWMIVSAEGNWVAGDTVAADKVLTGMFGDVTVHPLWSAKLYKINWVSGDTVQTVEFRFGDPTVTYPPIAKAGYTAAWDKTVPAVMPAEDLTFTAVYTPIQYYLRFNVAGGSEVENFYYDITSDKVLPTPTRTGANFKGWKVSAGTGSWVKNTIYPGGTSLTGHYGNITLTAQWEIELHTVTWVAGDVTKVTKWYHGATPSFDGIPYKSADEYHSYKFTGWDKEIVTVTEDATYTALFEATERLYTIRWNVDGHIQEEKEYRYGETPVFSGPEPTRPSTVEFDFSFAGWTPEVSKVTGDVTYVAQFDVYTKLQGLRVDKSAVFLEIGEQAVVSAIISPATATNKDVNWISSDESIATVDMGGKITAVGSGDTVIRVESKDGKFKSYCVVSVAPVISQYIVVSAGYVSTTRLPGEAIQLKARVMPENTTNKKVTWTSSDTSIAMVDQNGLVVFGNVPGTATITATSDGYASGSIEVTTVTDATKIEENTKTYVVMFMESTSQYVIAGTAYDAITIICAEGDTIEFLLTEPHFVTANGTQFARDTDGVYRIKNISQNYTIVSTERADIGFEDDDDQPAQKLSFFDRLKAFFRSIVEFFRSLFS